MRKKHYRTGITGLLLCAVLLGGCAETPDTAVVRQKNEKNRTAETKQEIETSISDTDTLSDTQNQTEAKSLAEKLGVPETYTSSVSTEDGVFSLTCDAQVEVPEVTSVSTWTVRQKKLDQNVIDQAVAALLEGTVIYDGEKYIQYSKTQITEKLDELKERQANGEDLQDAIDSWEELYADASDDIIKEEAEPELESEEDNLVLYGYYIAEADDGTAYALSLSDWSVSGYGIPMEITVERKFSEGTRIGSYSNWFESAAEYESAEVLADASEVLPSAEELEEKSGLTETEAVMMTDAYVQGLGLAEFSAKRTGTALLYLETEEDTDTQTPAAYAWVVEYTRDLDGVPVTCEASDGSSVEEDKLTVSPWYYEKLYFYVNADGLQYAKIQNLYELGEKKTENVKLLEFSEIASIFEQQMKLRHMDLYGVKKSSFVIDRVTFGYTRIYDPGTDNTTGTLVPVWDFFGSQEVTNEYVNKDTGETEEASYYSSAGTRSYLTINAMDGTVIDRDLGY